MQQNCDSEKQDEWFLFWGSRDVTIIASESKVLDNTNTRDTINHEGFIHEPYYKWVGLDFEFDSAQLSAFQLLRALYEWEILNLYLYYYFSHPSVINVRRVNLIWVRHQWKLGVEGQGTNPNLELVQGLRLECMDDDNERWRHNPKMPVHNIY
jgi:hypothetical protein